MNNPSSPRIRKGQPFTAAKHIGKKYSLWTVLSAYRRDGGTYAICRCDCGAEKEVFLGSVTNLTSKSCGCHRTAILKVCNRTHGKSTTKTWRKWNSMKQRCYNPADYSFPNWGGRGIQVCDRWMESFENFLADMGECPDGLTLGRIDNEGNYCPENCRWETLSQQSRNRRPWGTCARRRRSKDDIIAFVQSQKQAFPNGPQLSTLHST